MKYENLLMEYGNNLIIKEKPLIAYDGRIRGNHILIRKNMTQRQKACVLAEEIGHYYTTVGNILDQSDERNRKQEQKARLWAYNELIGLDGIIRVFESGCKDLHEIAEFLDVSTDFLVNALVSYQGKYGTKVKVGEYEISFVPILKVRKCKDRKDMEHKKT